MARAFQPTHKERKRYIVYEPAGHDDVINAFRTLFGTHGIASAGIIPVKERDGRGVLRVAHTGVDQAKAAIAWTGKRSVRVSGTLKKATQDL